MDLSEALVDLLLVRLGREEEKQRVLELLVTELHMTREEARSSVDEAPVVLLEAVPMGRARVIQNRLYPFVDLLPRMETVEDQPEEAAAADPDIDVSEEDFGELDSTGEQPSAPEQEEKLSVTSASEEVLSIERCHICGRTPTGGEKLAPCRSCSALTCRDCFDRLAHVCGKCAADGKVVDAPLGRVPGTRPQSRHGADATVAQVASGGLAKPSANLIYVLAGAAILAMLIAFYVIDPMKLFHSTTIDGSTPADYAVAVPADSVSTDIAAASDSTPATDSIPVPPGSTLSAVSGLPLPAGADTISSIAQIAPVDMAGAPQGVVLMAEETDMLTDDAGRIAATIPILLDRFAVLRLPDSTVVAAVTIIHPEDDTVRYALLRALGAWLTHGPVDELVFYYSESEYYPVRTVSFVRSEFARLADCMGPVDFQNCASTTSEEVWNLLTGGLQDWMARY